MGDQPSQAWKLARTYAAAPWVVVHQPQLHGAVVVASRVADYPLGALVPL